MHVCWSQITLLARWPFDINIINSVCYTIYMQELSAYITIKFSIINMPHVLVYQCTQGLLTFLNQVEKKIMVCATLVHLLDTLFSSRGCSSHWIHCVSVSGWVTGERKRRKDRLGNPHVIGYSHMINLQYGHVHKVTQTVTWSHDCHMNGHMTHMV